jgi:hypothetical protein
MPSSAPLPQFFVVIATLTRSHMIRGEKLKTELLSEAATPSIVTGNFERSDDRFCAFRIFPNELASWELLSIIVEGGIQIVAPRENIKWASS